MKRASLLFAAAASLALASGTVHAQSSGGHSGGGHSGGGRSGGGHTGGSHSGGHGGGQYHGGRQYHGGGQYRGGGRYYGGRSYYYGYGPRYYYPYSAFGWPFYAAPYYAYSYPVYASPPPPAEGYYMGPAPQPQPQPQPPQLSYQERSQALVVPPAPPSAPAPRIERMTLSAKELFAFDEATLHAPQPRLDEIADAMQTNPQIDKVRITGYTDRIGSDEYNLKLSQRRADAVRDYMVSFKGIDAKRLEAVGNGKADPVVQCDDEDRADLIKCLEPNRRVEVEEITVERRVP